MIEVQKLVRIGRREQSEEGKTKAETDRGWIREINDRRD